MDIGSEVNSTIVHVRLAERSYEIVIGRNLVESAGERIARLRPGAVRSLVVHAGGAGQRRQHLSQCAERGVCPEGAGS